MLIKSLLELFFWVAQGLWYMYMLLCIRDATGKFPEFPEEEDGGSAIIFAQKDPIELEKELKAKVNTSGIFSKYEI